MISNGHEVTLSVLNRSLRLARVPRCRLNELMHSVVYSLWFRQTDDPFFSLTVNALELSIFADAKLIDHAFGQYLEPTGQSDMDVIVDDNVWLALQVEQHSDDWDSSGARVKDISAPLAREGISIMFLATRYSDFLICKEHRLQQVLRILQENGFGFAAEPDAHHASGTASPARKRTQSPTRSSSVTGSLVLTRSMSTSATSSPARMGSRDAMTSSIESLVLDDERGRARRSRMATSETIMADSVSEEPDGFFIGPGSPSLNDLPRSFPKNGELASTSSLNSEILASSLAILPDELVCVGLALDHENLWREKLIRALFFCEDVLPPPAPPHTNGIQGSRDADVEDELWESAHENGDAIDSGGLRSPSISPTSNRPHPLAGPQSVDEMSETLGDEADPAQPVSTSQAPYPAPFFGFTKTSEGPSLTADIRLLRALFSPAEEETLVLASGEGGLSGTWSGEGVDPSERSRHQRSAATFDGDVSNGHSDGTDHGRTLLKCLQVDLSHFGLDRHGIVNSLADFLTNEGINLLYHSTFRTANILVSKGDLMKAQRVLQAHTSV